MLRQLQQDPKPFSYINILTVGELKDWTKRNLWSKTTLNTLQAVSV